MRNIETNKAFLILIILTFIGGFLHFFSINWGSPYFFHPDERNIASSVSQLKFPEQLNPNFFAYGSLPIYTIFFSGLLINKLMQFLVPSPLPLTPTFEQAILISRFYSALFATLLIPILFFIGEKLIPRPAATPFSKGGWGGFLAAFLATTSVGFIQFAHFGTFEMWLTFFSVLLFWLCLQKPTTKTVLLMGGVFGILVATKVSSLALLPLPILAFLIKNPKSEIRNPKQYQNTNDQKKKRFEFLKFKHLNLFRISIFDIRILDLIKKTLFFFITASLLYIFSNLYVFLDTSSFESSMKYESSVALGTLPVFYTHEFINSIPALFQLQNIYPFLLNPLITVMFIPSFFSILYKGIKTKNISYLLLTTFFLLLFFSQAFLFVKWTRYMVPTLPFVYLMVAIAITNFVHSEKAKERKNALLHFCTFALIVSLCTTFALSYFITAFVRTDTRIAAQNFATQTIPTNASVLSEIYDLGIMPFNPILPNISLFNFYDLDANPLLEAELQTKLAASEYIILPSQRLLKIRLTHATAFPKGHDFYQQLINGKLGYTMVYQTPCDIFCKITYLGDPTFRYEETANVFERPTVFIFKKM